MITRPSRRGGVGGNVRLVAERQRAPGGGEVGVDRGGIEGHGPVIGQVSASEHPQITMPAGCAT